MSDLSPEQPRPKKRKWWRTAGILALLLVGWCAVRESEKKPETGSEKSVAESEKKPVAKSEKSVKEAQTSTPKQLPSTQSQTKSVEDDVNRLQSTKNDIETKMGLVYYRDSHNKYPDITPRDYQWTKRQGPIDDKLTAEEVFASRQKDQVQVVVQMSSQCKDCLTTQALSDSEVLRYWGLIRIHQMAALTLYSDRCSDQLLDYDRGAALAIIVGQFKKLPREVQDRALDHQTKAIEARQDYISQSGPDKGTVYPGGWKWFCGKMNSDIKYGDGAAAVMFKTAREGYFPIAEN